MEVLFFFGGGGGGGRGGENKARVNCLHNQVLYFCFLKNKK